MKVEKVLKPTCVRDDKKPQKCVYCNRLLPWGGHLIGADYYCGFDCYCKQNNLEQTEGRPKRKW